MLSLLLSLLWKIVLDAATTKRMTGTGSQSLASRSRVKDDAP
jgi:hypothetical protein